MNLPLTKAQLCPRTDCHSRQTEEMEQSCDAARTHQRHSFKMQLRSVAAKRDAGGCQGVGGNWALVPIPCMPGTPLQHTPTGLMHLAAFSSLQPPVLKRGTGVASLLSTGEEKPSAEGRQCGSAAERSACSSLLRWEDMKWALLSWQKGTIHVVGLEQQ